MTTASHVESGTERYLSRVRVALRGLPDAEIADILRELRSHIVEIGEAGRLGEQAALASLGDPVDLAKTYRTDNLMTQAECVGSPLVILQGLRHASRSQWGRVAVSALYFFGYANVLSLWAAALDGLFTPSRSSWWVVPAYLVLGWILQQAIDRTAQWWIRRYRRSNASL
jgi:uncharacterized membrane protein